MKKMNDKSPLMNLPVEVKAMISNGTFCLYRLANKAANGAPYLLEFSKDQTFYVSEEGNILTSAGRLDSIDVEEVIRFDEPAPYAGIKVNIA